MTFEIGHTDAVLPLAGLSEGGKHQLETAAFVEDARDGFGAATFFDEGSLHRLSVSSLTAV